MGEKLVHELCSLFGAKEVIFFLPRVLSFIIGEEFPHWVVYRKCVRYPPCALKEPPLALKPVYQVGKREGDSFLICMPRACISLHPFTFYLCYNTTLCYSLFLGRDFLFFQPMHPIIHGTCIPSCTPWGVECMHTTEQIHTLGACMLALLMLASHPYFGTCVYACQDKVVDARFAWQICMPFYIYCESWMVLLV